ncbi:MAG: hypothetical protein ACLFV7_06175 [Phycisphaerae bacterium]
MKKCLTIQSAPDAGAIAESTLGKLRAAVGEWSPVGRVQKKSTCAIVRRRGGLSSIRPLVNSAIRSYQHHRPEQHSDQDIEAMYLSTLA